jgi:hypothetical protein
MSKTQIYPLTKRPQLIDLNGENVNFKLDFQVKSINPEHEFNAIVLTQEQLDSVDINKIEMKNAKGKINGNIVANNNKYQNYFLVLKKLNASTPDFNVQVDIALEPVEAVEQPQGMESTSAPEETISTDQQPIPQPVQQTVKPFYRKPWFAVFVLLVLLGVGFLIYNCVILKKPLLFWNKAPKSASIVQPILTAPVSVAPVSAPVPAATPAKLTAIPSIPESTVENNLYKKLQEIA